MSKKKSIPVQESPAVPSQTGNEGMIVLSDSIDLAKDLRIEHVLAYLKVCYERASKENALPQPPIPKTKKGRQKKSPSKNSEDAELIFNIAHGATALLSKLVEIRPEILESRLLRSPPLLFPLLVERKKWPKALLKLAGVQKPNEKTRVDAAPQMTEHMQSEARRLLSSWREWQRKIKSPIEDDRDHFAKIDFTSILANESETGAVQHLPTPSQRTFRLWWDLEEAILKRDFESNEIGFWFVHPVILRAAKKSDKEPDLSSDPDEARHTVAKNYQSAFIQELRKLVNQNVK